MDVNHYTTIPMKRIVLLLGLCLCSLCAVHGQHLLFNHFRLKENLSQHSVLSVYQDEYDRLWIATRDGLNLYDGSRNQVFQHLPGDTLSLFGNTIQGLTGDGRGSIYAQCQSGLVRYDMLSEQFEVVTRQGVMYISHGTDRLWSSYEHHLSYLDSITHRLVPYLSHSAWGRVSAHLQLKDGTLMIGCRDQGLWMADRNKKTRQLLPAHVSVVTLYEDNQNRCWVGTREHGVYVLAQNRVVQHFTHTAVDPHSLSHNFVRAICQDNQGNFWLGTYQGLCFYDSSLQRFTLYDHSDVDPFSLSNSSVWCITKDRQGTLWIGTFFGGLDCFNPEFSFKQYYRAGLVEGVRGSVIGSAVEDTAGNLWLCTENGGLSCREHATGRFSSYTHLPGQAGTLSSDVLKSIALDTAQQALWVGTHMGGLNRFDLATRRATRITLNANDPAVNNYVRAVCPHAGLLYLGTHNGVAVYNPATGTCHSLVDNVKEDLDNKQVWDMMIDHRHQLWFSTGTAFYRYDLPRKQLHCYLNDPLRPQSTAACYNNTFFEDRDGTVWIGSSGGGLERYDPRTESFTHYTTLNSQLMDNYVLDIAQSALGYLLIATNKGLSRFDIQNASFSNYRNNSFFPFSALNERCLYVTSSGEIVIGSTSGLLVMNEQDFNYLDKTYSVLFSRLWVNNKPVSPGDATGILRSTLLTTPAIGLNHTQTTFSIEYGVTNYINAIQPQVEYMLEGFDTDWISDNGRRQLTYTNLPPGEYVLKIRGRVDNALSPESLLTVRVSPPFYKTWVAYLVYTLGVLWVLYFIFANYVSRIRLASSLLFAQKEKEQIESMNLSKLRFFTNISHEFRTPITLVISQLELILQNSSVPHGEYSRLLSMTKNMQQMRRLIDELLTFSKQEQGHLKLHYCRQNLIDFVNDIYVPFKEYAVARHIYLHFVYKSSDLDVWIDTAQMEKVFYNLLSNAFKFTPERGTITIQVEQDSLNARVSIIDTGVGIEEEAIDKVFDRFFQGTGTGTGLGTGIGLAFARSIVEAHGGTISVDSQVGTGSTFLFTLPLGEAHIAPEQKTSASSPHDLPARIELPDTEYLTEIINQQKASELETTILIIEDNPELLEVLQKIFEPIYHVITATNGINGFDQVLEHQPDIVLSDVMMPQLSGTDLCKKIKTNMDTCHIPVVLLTARVATDHILEGLLMGADDYITKPFQAKILIARCNNLVRGRKLLQTQFLQSPKADPHILATSAYDQEVIQKAIDVVERNILNPDFDVAFFAQEMCLGRTNLFSKIKGITGQTPNEFITTIRLKRGAYLLLERWNEDIDQIACLVGYNDTSYFNKRFKKLFGKTPTQYRAEQREGKE